MQKFKARFQQLRLINRRARLSYTKLYRSVAILSVFSIALGAGIAGTNAANDKKRADATGASSPGANIGTHF